MSAKSENRYYQWQTQYYSQKAEEGRATRFVDRLCLDLFNAEERIKELEARVKELEAGYHKRGVYLNAERERNKELHQEIYLEKQEKRRWINAFLSQKKSHEKLGAIVRLALSPEKYREWRDAAAHIFPRLFGWEVKPDA